jgi:hypothetical protein
MSVEIALSEAGAGAVGGRLISRLLVALADKLVNQFTCPNRHTQLP